MNKKTMIKLMNLTNLKLKRMRTKDNEKMNDETYGQNEPPEPEDLDLNDDDEIMGEDDDKADDENELPPEEDQRLPDFEETPEEETKENEDQEKQEITKSTGGNAGQDE